MLRVLPVLRIRYISSETYYKNLGLKLPVRTGQTA